MSETKRRSPYQGLIPFDEEDAPFFFGREKETRLISANLFATPFTLLYGASGVGKSSVLRAGVAHQFRQRDDLLIVVFSAWQSDPLAGLRAALAEAVTRATGATTLVSESLSLSESLSATALRLNRRVMLILDQFEEYFLYHPQDDAFATQFPRAVTQSGLPASFLISIREDSLAKLDRFEGRIPNLFDNYLRLEHLDRDAARDAIVKPVRQYNREIEDRSEHVRVEPELVDAVIEQVRIGRVFIGETGRGQIARQEKEQVQIETPYLQLVMTRLWDEEMRFASYELRLETLSHLGGAESIVKTHLDAAMNTLSAHEQNVAARVFRYLVTPSGNKIAHALPDLAEYADVSEAELTPLIEKLSSSGIRILHAVAQPHDRPAPPRYEIFHDVLVLPIQDWRARVEHRLRKDQALLAIDTILISHLDPPIALNKMLDQVISQLRIDAADILLLNPVRQTLEYAAGHGFRFKEIERSRLVVGEGHAGLAAFERRIVSIPNMAEARDELERSVLLEKEGFVSYCAVPLIAKGQLKGVLEILNRTTLDANQEWLEFLETLSGQVAIAIDNMQWFGNIQDSLDLTVAYDATIETWSHALDLRDKETEGHTQRVTEMTLRLARTIGMREDQLVHVRQGALLHDIGKMGIPDSILLKPGPLTDEEWELMRKHPLFAYELLSPIEYLRPALDIPYCHHEKWDGTGFPRGLKGEQIPLAARIFAVVDVWDALSSDRPYRRAWQKAKVREHIKALAGTHFDPMVVQKFLEIES